MLTISDKRLMRYEEKFLMISLHRILRTNCSRSDKRKVLYMNFGLVLFSWETSFYIVLVAHSNT